MLSVLGCQWFEIISIPLFPTSLPCFGRRLYWLKQPLTFFAQISPEVSKFQLYSHCQLPTEPMDACSIIMARRSMQSLLVIAAWGSTLDEAWLRTRNYISWLCPQWSALPLRVSWMFVGVAYPIDRTKENIPTPLQILAFLSFDCILVLLK